MRKDNHVSSVSNAIRCFRHLKGITNDHQGFHDLNVLVWRVVMELVEEGLLETIPLGQDWLSFPKSLTTCYAQIKFYVSNLMISCDI
jgi:hypothetical protein